MKKVSNKSTIPVVGDIFCGAGDFSTYGSGICAFLARFLSEWAVEWRHAWGHGPHVEETRHRRNKVAFVFRQHNYSCPRWNMPKIKLPTAKTSLRIRRMLHKMHV